MGIYGIGGYLLVNEDQKAIFCDAYCKYLERFNNAIAYSKAVNGYGKELAVTFARSKRLLSAQCEKCPLNEVEK